MCPQTTGMCSSRPGENMPSSTKEPEKRIADAGSQVTPSVTAHSSGESQASQGVAASCEIPVEVHGSQKGGTQYAAVIPFHEETRTVIVFPHGCVLRLATPVGVGQMLAITNQNSQRGMLTRVTHVRSYPNLKSYVEIEFTQADPEFWSIDFAEESAAQGYLPGPAASAPAAKSHDFWTPSESNAGAQTSSQAPRAAQPQQPGAGEAIMPPWQEKPAVAPPPTPAGVSADSSAKKKQVTKTSAAPSAAEFSLAPQAEKKPEAAPEESSSSQAWAELLVMEPQQQQLSAKELASARSDVEESLAPAPPQETEAHAAAPGAVGDAIPSDFAHPEPISESVLKELEKLALAHVSEKVPAAESSESESHLAADVSAPTTTRKEPAKKSAAPPAKSEPSHESGAPARSSPLHTFTGESGGSEGMSKLLHSFTGTSAKGKKESPLHSFTPPVSEAESLPGVIDGVNPHKTQSLADHSDAAGAESDFGNFLRDPEPRTAAARVFTGPSDAIAPRTTDAHLSLAPLKAKRSKSGVVLGALVVILAGIVFWWFHPFQGNRAANNAFPAASAPSPVNSPSQWPSQSPNDAATLDSSGGHPVAVESQPAASPASEPAVVESKPEPDSGAREIIPVPKSSAKPPAGAGKAQPSATNSHASLPAVTLTAPTASGNPAASGSVEPPPDVAAGTGASGRSNNLSGIVGSSPANVPAPSAPVEVGGRVKEPRLISSVTPVYPQTAMQANVQGDVKIQATIDQAGHVVKMKVISGPALLQRAALDAVKQWRYEPSVLNEKPISVDMVVTVRFRR